MSKLLDNEVGQVLLKIPGFRTALIERTVTGVCFLPGGASVTCATQGAAIALRTSLEAFLESQSEIAPRGQAINESVLTVSTAAIQMLLKT